MLTPNNAGPVQQTSREPTPQDQTTQPLNEVAEILETDDRTFEAALLYNAAHGAEHAGLTLLFGIERI